MKSLALNPKRIFIITAIIGSLGLISELLAFVQSDFVVVWWLRVAGGFVNLDVFNWFTFVAWNSWINVVNPLLYIMLLLGAVIYFKNGARHSRILRACLAIILISCAIALFFGFYHMFTEFSFIAALSLLRTGFAILFCFTATQFLNTEITNGNAIGESHEYAEVGKGQRFVNLMVDSTLFMLIFSPWFNTFAPVIRGLFGREFGETYVLCALLIFSRIAYYLISEASLDGTPAKFMMGSKVVTWQDQKPTFGAYLKRTLCRFIPFESFTFFGENGLHDQMSETCVVNEIPVLKK